jgi:hypothetical protein
MPKFFITETIHSEKIKTVRGGTTTNKYGNAENGKAVKLAALENYVLCADGDAIEAIQQSSNFDRQGTVDGYAIIGIVDKGYKTVVAEGGTLAPGDYVVCGTPVAFGTALTAPLKVKKAADQAVAKAAPFKARVVGLGPVGTGAVGTQVVIELL